MLPKLFNAWVVFEKAALIPEPTALKALPVRSCEVLAARCDEPNIAVSGCATSVLAAGAAPALRLRVRAAGRVELERAFLRSPPLRVLRGLVDFTDMPHTLMPQLY